jgi:hypothetical protein
MGADYPAFLNITGPLKYSLPWAIDIVRRLKLTHPRGWEILAPILKLNVAQVAIVLAAGKPEWAQIRRICHSFEAWEVRQRTYGPKPLNWTTQMYSNLLKIHEDNTSNALFSHLTGNLSGLTMNSQGISGAPACTAKPDRLEPPPFSSDFFSQGEGI